MRKKSWQLLLQIVIGILLNIAVSYFILPHLLPGFSRKHFNVTDIYIAIYLGLAISLIELILIWFGVLLIMD